MPGLVVHLVKVYIVCSAGHACHKLHFVTLSLKLSSRNFGHFLFHLFFFPLHFSCFFYGKLQKILSITNVQQFTTQQNVGK